MTLENHKISFCCLNKLCTLITLILLCVLTIVPLFTQSNFYPVVLSHKGNLWTSIFSNLNVSCFSYFHCRLCFMTSQQTQCMLCVGYKDLKEENTRLY